MERGEGDAAMNAGVRQTMSRQVEQLVRLTGDLLDVSRISLGKIHLKRDVVALGSVLEQAVEACAPSNGPGNICSWWFPILLPTSMAVQRDWCRCLAT
jgi:signal transduction histidine kinase